MAPEKITIGILNHDNDVYEKYVAQSLKKLLGDYDLIIEAYEDSLSKTLPEGLREEAEASKDAAYRKKKTFDNFWK